MNQSTPATEPSREPRISVLILTYNHAAYLPQALDSVLAQAIDVPFEVLVGDDASTDGTSEIARAYAERFPDKVRTFVHPENLGMHRNHAFLLRQAQGEFVAYCEGDDLWVAADKLQCQLTLFKRNPSLGLVHSNYYHLIRLGKHWRVRRAFRSARELAHRSGDIFNAMLQANRIQTCTVLCRTLLLRECRSSGLDVDGYSVVDWPYFLHLTRHHEIAFIAEPLSAYRRTPGSATNSGARRRLEFGRDAIRMVNDFCDHFGTPNDIRHAALVAQHRTLLSLAFQAGDANAFDHAWRWLSTGERGILGAPRFLVMRWLMDFPAIGRGCRQCLAIFAWFKHWVEFRQFRGVR